MSRLVLSNQQLNELPLGTRVKVVGYVLDYSDGRLLLRLTDDVKPLEINLGVCIGRLDIKLFPGTSVVVDGYWEDAIGRGNCVNPVAVALAGIEDQPNPADAVDILRQMAQIRSQSSMP